MKKYIYFCSLVLICVELFFCSYTRGDDVAGPSTIRVGVLPDDSRERLQSRYEKLLKYLSEETGLRYELLIPDTYHELLNLFHEAEVDLAYFGGYTFVMANIKDDAFPLVMRNVDIQFTSYFLARMDRPEEKISDFKDKVFCYGSKLSTSGHLMPRFFLTKKKIMPETFFSEVRYSGSHDKTVFWVNDGLVDLGVVNSKIADKLFEDGYLKREDVRIVWKTPPYADYVWAVQSSVKESTQIIIRDAFLNLSLGNEEHQLILDRLNANYYIPAGEKDFADIKSIIEITDNP